MQAGLTLEADMIGISANLRHTSLLVKAVHNAAAPTSLRFTQITYCTKPGSGTGVVVEKCVQDPVLASR